MVEKARWKSKNEMTQINEEGYEEKKNQMQINMNEEVVERRQ
jgi:hypothetical protein